MTGSRLPARIAACWVVALLVHGALSAAEPRLDVHGEPLPAGAIGRLGTDCFRAGGEIKTLSFAPDGRTLVSGSIDGVIRFWDPKTGKEVRRFTGHRQAVTCLAFSADGKKLASGSHDQTARIWDVAGGKELLQIPSSQGWITAVAFAPDGKTLACANRGNLVTLHETATGALTHRLEGHSLWVTAVVFAKDGKTVISGAKDRSIRRWNVATGAALESFEGQSTMVYALALAADGKTLASGSNDYAVHLWDMETGKERRQLDGHRGSVYAVAYTPDGRTVASASRDGTIHLWDPVTGKSRHVIPTDDGEVSAIAISPDGKTIASAGKTQSIRLWDLATAKESGMRREGHDSAVFELLFSANGRELISNGRDRTLRVWDVETSRQRLTLRGHSYSPYALALSPDGKTLASVSEDRTIRTWSMRDGSERIFRDLDTREVVDLMFTPENELLAWFAGPGNREIRNRPIAQDPGDFHEIELRVVTDGKSRQRFGVDLGAIQKLKPGSALQVVLDWPGHLGRVSTVAVSPGRTLIASGGHDKNIILWDAPSGKLLHKLVGHEGDIDGLAFSADDRLLMSTAADNTIRLWEMATRRQLAIMPLVKSDIRVAALASDGRTLAWAAMSDKQIHLWDVVHDRELPSLEGHTEPINALVFSPDNSVLASGSADTTVFLWNIKGVLDKARLGADSFSDVRDPGRIWMNLANDDASVGYAAVWTLLGSKPDQVLAFLKDRLKLEVGKQPTVADLIDDLDSGTFQVRRRATETLENMGAIVRPDIVKALQVQPSFEMRRRLEQILMVVDSRRGRLTQEELRQVRAVLVLEWLGTAEATQFLQEIAKGPPNWWQTREARSALQRLDKIVAAR